MKYTLLLVIGMCYHSFLSAQPDTIVLGYGGFDGVTVSSSGDPLYSDPENTLKQTGYLPNQNAASRFLTQATLGHNISDIDDVTLMGIEDWIEDQIAMDRPWTLLDKVREYHDFVRDETENPFVNSTARMWDYSWWQYHMTSEDALRQRVALALSEILVISDKSEFRNNAYALADYYDLLLDHSFGNFRDLLENITYHASMGVYLTYMNNPKTDIELNQYPDENYAREIMQLFTIGLYMLNEDGTLQLDANGDPIPTYDNEDIAEFSKIFTGLSWADRDDFGRGARKDTSYIHDMQMFTEEHELGEKYLLNGFVVPDRPAADSELDIDDALDNLFNHQNVGPFIGKHLIQRMVTSNPSPTYVYNVTNAFNDNGAGVRGDMAAVVRAILLDPEALACASALEPDFGKLREPFIRYFQINKAFNASTISGNYRNDMDYIEDYTSQKPLASPSVFNFFQTDFQPLGPIQEEGKVAPEFQITDAQTIAGWLNALYRFVVQGNIADEYDFYSGEPNDNYADEISTLDFSTELMYTVDNQLHILMDRLNLVLAQGRLSQVSIDKIISAVSLFPNDDLDDQMTRVELMIYLVMSSPEYLIHR